MFIIIPVVLMLFLEFVIEPVFKIRQKTLNRLGWLAGITVFLLTFSIWYILIVEFPNVDKRIFTFTCIGILIYFIPKK
jgi:4-amino-4-deoxy-L-arabinose transferase-like glycosyltransferase